MKIPDPLRQSIFDLQGELLDLVDDATSIEINLFDGYGETRETQSSLETLAQIKQDAEDAYQRLCTLLGNIAKETPDTAFDNMRTLRQSEVRLRDSLPDIKRTVQKIRRDWRLP